MPDGPTAPAPRPSGGLGHLISAGQLFGFLGVVGCDQGPDGRYHVDGLIVSFMGMGEEYIVGPEAVFYRQGKASSLAVNLRGTSYGLAITVI